MSGFERQKHGLQLAQVQPERVQNLGKDLMGLFGAVSTGAETYAKLGEEAATIDARDKILNATNEITLLKQELVKYEEANDTQGILNVKAGINSIVASVKSYGDEEDGEYKNNIPARNRFNSLVDEWGASTLSTWMPALDQKWIGAAKNKLFNEAQSFANAATEASIPISPKDTSSYVSIVKGFGLNDEAQRKVAETLITTNLQNASGAFYENPNKFIIDTKLIKDGKFDRAARQNILDKYLPHFTFSEDGNIVPVSNDMMVTQEDVLKVEKFLNTIESSFSQNGDAYNADFRLAINEVEKLISAKLNGDSGISLTDTNHYLKIIEEYPKELLSTSEKNMMSMTASKLKDLRYKQEAVSQDVNANFGNPNALFYLITEGSENINAKMFEAEVQNQIEKRDTYIDTLVANGEFTAASALMLETAKIAKRLDLKSSTISKYNAIMDGSGQVNNINELKASLEFMSAMSNANMSVRVGQDPEDEITQGSINLIATSVSVAEREATKLYPDDKQKQFSYVVSAFNNSKKQQKNTFKRIFKSNEEFIVRKGSLIEGKLNDILNLGSSEFDALGYSSYFANMAAKQNIALDEDNVEEFLSSNTTRLSSWVPFAEATIVPKLISSDGKEVTQGQWEAFIDASWQKVAGKNAPRDSNTKPVIRMVDNAAVLEFVYEDGYRLPITQRMSADDIGMFEEIPEEIKRQQETKVSNKKIIKAGEQVDKEVSEAIGTEAYEKSMKILEKNQRQYLNK